MISVPNPHLCLFPIEIAADGYLIETVNSILSSNVSEFPEHSFAFFRHLMKSDSSSAVTAAPSHESANGPSKPAEEIVVPSINKTLTTLGRKAIAAKREGNNKLLPAADLTKLDDAAFDRFLSGSRPLLLFSVNVSSVSVYLFATPHAELESTQKLSSLIPIRDPLMYMLIESIQVVSLILQRNEGLLLTIGVQSMTILDARTLPGDNHSLSGTQSISSGEWRPFTSFTTVLSLNPPTPPEGTVVKKPTHMVKNTTAPLITQLFTQFDLLCKTSHGIKGVQITRFREVKEDIAVARIVSQPHALISGLFTLQDPQILVSNPARLKLVREEGMNKELALSQNAFIAALFPNKEVPLYPLSYYDTSLCHRILAPTNISVSFSLRSAFDVNTSDNKHVILQDCTSDAPNSNSPIILCPPTPPQSVGIVTESDAMKEPPHPFSILASIAEAMTEITKATGLSFSC
ncbi:hypothetical protein BLNAU_24177 [Blattamonas nauphoetae]|uniref:Mediator of RNA polymerase II transcription subunit 1 n=1 Tax=Blattamonas nauphoetae TaxID=2049346 RepID=A0ABQ9WN41_9EUKA|nr:hypothetical protein BLNAU_24177 [Blattamonas nauphoetae]